MIGWDAVGAIGEVLGGGAVVVSLLYLGLQIRAQTRQSRISAMHDISVGLRDAIAHFQSEQMAQLFVSATKGMEHLEEYQRFQLLIGCQKCLRVWEEAFYMHRDGYLDANHWDGMNRQFQQFFTLPAFRYTWAARREFYGSEFRHMVEHAPAIEYRLAGA